MHFPVDLHLYPSASWNFTDTNESLRFSPAGGLTMGLPDRANSSNNHSDPFGRNEEVAKLEITVLSVTFVVAVVGNLSVLLAMHNTKKKMSRMHLFIKHLSLADLVVAFFQVLPQLCWEITFRFYGPDFLCRIVKHLQVLGMFASTYMMVMMTLDRYIAICHPLKTLQQPTQRSYMMIISTWICSLVLSSPQYFIFSLSEIKNGSDVYDCWGHFIKPWGVKAYITWITVGIFLIPVVILVICYGFICHSIWKNIKYKTKKGTTHAASKGGFIGRSSVNSVTTISRAKLRTVKMTLVIVLAYIVCWAPFFIVQMWSVWDENFSWDGKLFVRFTLMLRRVSRKHFRNTLDRMYIWPVAMMGYIQTLQKQHIGFRVHLESGDFQIMNNFAQQIRTCFLGTFQKVSQRSSVSDVDMHRLTFF